MREVRAGGFGGFCWSFSDSDRLCTAAVQLRAISPAYTTFLPKIGNDVLIENAKSVVANAGARDIDIH